MTKKILIISGSPRAHVCFPLSAQSSFQNLKSAHRLFSFLPFFLKFLLPPESDFKTKKVYTIVMISISCIIATVVVFIAGIIGFKIVTSSTMTKTLAAVLIPFIPGNLIKIVVMVPLTYNFRKVISVYRES